MGKNYLKTNYYKVTYVHKNGEHLWKAKTSKLGSEFSFKVKDALYGLIKDNDERGAEVILSVDFLRGVGDAALLFQHHRELVGKFKALSSLTQIGVLGMMGNFHELLLGGGDKEKMAKAYETIEDEELKKWITEIVGCFEDGGENFSFSTFRFDPQKV